MKNHKRQSGFTLVELMVTLAVLIVTLTVGIPFYSSIVAHNRVAALNTSLATSINLAKSEAIGRGNDVYLCATSACNSNDWNDGWSVYDGRNNAVLRRWPEVEPDMRIETTVEKLTFDYAGVVDVDDSSISGAAQFIIAEANASDVIQSALTYVRCVNINLAGRIKSEKPAAADNGSFDAGTTTLSAVNCP